MKRILLKIIRVLSLAALVAISLAMAACTPLMPIDQDPSAGYTATFIARKVPGLPGTVSWSPNGQYLAYLNRKGKEVTLYDPASGEKIPFEFDRPFFLSWANTLSLLIVHGDRGSPVLTLLDIKSKKAVRYPLPLNTVALFGEPDEHYAWAFTENHEWRSIGVDATYALFRPDWKKNSIGEVANINRIVSIMPQATSYLRGWARVGPSPVSGAAILLQLISPPAAPTYLKVLAVDTVTLDETEVMKIRNDWLTKRASWSPTGQRLAVAGNDGLLKVLSMDGTLQTVDEEVVGISPDWDPRGGRIFFGGYFFADDGSERKRLVAGKAKETSVAFFSPLGDSMVLSIRGNIWLIRGIKPAPRAFKESPDVLHEKADKLKKLYRDDLITKEDYRGRLTELLGQFEQNR